MKKQNLFGTSGVRGTLTRKITSGLVIGAALSLSAAAHAIPITTDGEWVNVLGNPSGGVTYVDPDSNGTDNTILWGTPASGANSGQSAYIFTGVSTNAPTDGSLFELGTFTHNNFTIYLPSIDGASLNVFMDLGSMIQSFSFDFMHNETNNAATTCAVAGTTNPCPDEVTIPNAQSTQSVTIGGVDYVLAIAGFSSDFGATISNNFITQEGQSNSASLYSSLQVAPSQVALPSTFALGLIGFLSLRLARKRS